MRRRAPFMPLDPTTIRSASTDSATLISTSAGAPGTACVVTGIGATRLATSVSSSSHALRTSKAVKLGSGTATTPVWATVTDVAGSLICRDQMEGRSAALGEVDRQRHGPRSGVRAVGPHDDLTKHRSSL